MTEVILGLGSNCDAKARLTDALQSLEKLLTSLKASPWYESEALNKTGPNYLNLVVVGQTRLTAEQLLEQLKTLELNAGRQADCRDCPLDIDLLTYGDLALPRNDLTAHAHVLLPLAELCPESYHPELGICYAELWAELSPTLLTGQRLWPAK